MRESIAVAAVCLLVVMCSAGRARAEEEDEQAQGTTRDDGAPASVELALSVQPTGLLALASMQLVGGVGSGTGTGGLGALGGVGAALTPTLDVGIALDPSVLLVLGVGASYRDGAGASYALSVPIAVLWYLAPPRVGHVMPMLRVGAALGYAHAQEPTGPELASWSVGAVVRGGLTWLPARELGVRAEVGARGGVSDTTGALNSGFGASLGLDAIVSLVLRLS